MNHMEEEHGHATAFRILPRRHPRSSYMLSAILCLGFGAGCTHIRLSPPGLTAKAASEQKLSLDGCEVAMQLAHGDGIMPFGELPDDAKTPLRDGSGLYVVSKPVCVKRSGGDISLDEPIMLLMDDAARDHYGFCDGGTEETPASTDPQGKLRARVTCTWNRTFRHAYPLSFVLYSLDGKPLAQRVRAVRVFLNGELVYRWLGKEGYPNTPLSGGEVLFIPGNTLRRDLMPHLAPIDIRIVPAGADIDDLDLQQEATRYEDKAYRQIRAAVKGMLSSKVLADGKLKDELQKLEKKAETLVCQGSSVFQYDNPSKSCNGTPPEVPGEFVALYQKLKSEATSELGEAERRAVQALLDKLGGFREDGKKALDDFKTEAEKYWKGEETWRQVLAEATSKGKAADLAQAQTLDDFRTKATADAKALVKVPDDLRDPEFLRWFKLRTGGHTIEEILHKGEETILTALATMDDAMKLVEQVRGDVDKLRQNRQQQAQLFNDTLRSLEETTLFSQYAENPPALEGEALLPMKFADAHQWFVLAPWHGVAIRPADDLDTQFNAATLFPIIDVVGIRWQFGQSRFSDARIAMGAANLVEELDGKNVYTLAPQLNLSIANIRAGVGYAAVSGEMPDRFSDGLRIFIGADLAKLITGRNLEAASF